MDTSKLTMTIRAYQKVSPSALSNYITRDQLEEELNNYVTEAPEDGKIYARQDKQWSELQKEAQAQDTLLIFGSNSTLTLDANLLDKLDRKYNLGKDPKSFDIDYTMTEQGYFWICTNNELKNIRDGNLGWSADFIKQKNMIEYDNQFFYCYSITDELIAWNWKFIVEF